MIRCGFFVSHVHRRTNWKSTSFYNEGHLSLSSEKKAEEKRERKIEITKNYCRRATLYYKIVECPGIVRMLMNQCSDEAPDNGYTCIIHIYAEKFLRQRYKRK